MPLPPSFGEDPTGRIVYCNEGACRSLGRSREELLSLSISEIDPCFPPDASQAIWNELKKRGSMTFETVHRTKQGRLFPVEVTANYLQYGDKEYSFAFARDITERKQAENALRASELRHRQFLERSASGVIRNTLDGRIVDCNAAIVRLLGYGSLEELKACRMPELYFDPMERDAMVAILMRERVLTGREFRLKRKDGTPVWILANITVVEDEGRLVVEGIGVDITDRKQAEAALRESEERYRLLFDQMLMGFALVEVIYDENGTPCDYRNLAVNPAFDKHTGLTGQEVVGQGFARFCLTSNPSGLKPMARWPARENRFISRITCDPFKKWFEVTAFRAGATWWG